MNAYIEKFSPACPPYPVGPVMGYYSGGGPACRRPSLLPEIDLSHRPGSLQEAICMYIDFLMAENEVRTRISECAIASPPPPLDFHREEYYRDVMCRPVNFPTGRFRDWLKRYNVDIEITDPDGETVSQTTFAPLTPVTESAEAGPAGTDGAGWPYAEDVSAVPPHRRRHRLAANRGGVICHGGGGAVQFGPPDLEHPLLHLQAESRGIPVEMLGPSSDELPMRASVNFTPHSTDPSPSSVYHVQPPPVPQPCVPSVGGCGYGSLPVEEEEEEDRKEELQGSAMPVSGWPDVTVQRPESSRAGTTVDSPNFKDDVSDQPLSGSSADPYFQEGGTRCSDEQFDSRCFASDEAAAADQPWTAGVVQSPVDNHPIIDVDPNQLGREDPDNLTHVAETSRGLASAPVLDGGSFPVVIEPRSLSESCISTTAVVQEFGTCFANDGSAGCQLPYAAGSDGELYSGSAPLGEAAGPETGTTTPPSQSANTATCLELGSDFADLLGTQHSDEFDYHLNYGTSVASNLSSKDLTDNVPPAPRRRRAGRSPKSVTMRSAGPARKFSRRESTDHK